MIPSNIFLMILAYEPSLYIDQSHISEHFDHYSIFPSLHIVFLIGYFSLFLVIGIFLSDRVNILFIKFELSMLSDRLPGARVGVRKSWGLRPGITIIMGPGPITTHPPMLSWIWKSFVLNHRMIYFKYSTH